VLNGITLPNDPLGRVRVVTDRTERGRKKDKRIQDKREKGPIVVAKGWREGGGRIVCTTQGSEINASREGGRGWGKELGPTEDFIVEGTWKREGRGPPSNAIRRFLGGFWDPHKVEHLHSGRYEFEPYVMEVLPQSSS